MTRIMTKTKFDKANTVDKRFKYLHVYLKKIYDFDLMKTQNLLDSKKRLVKNSKIIPGILNHICKPTKLVRLCNF